MRAEKVAKLVDALERRAAKTAGREILAVSADAPLVGEEALDVDWDELAVEAGCHVPSDTTKADVLWQVKHRIDTMNDDPFAGL